MCIKSPLLKNKGLSKLIKKEVFQKLYFTKMTPFLANKVTSGEEILYYE